MADPIIQNTPYTQAQNLVNAPNNPNASSTLQDPNAVPVPQAQSPNIPIPTVPEAISTKVLGGGTTPLVLPPIPKGYGNNIPNTYVPPPQGTTIGENGLTTVTPPPTPTADTSSQSWIKSTMQGAITALGLKPAATSVAQQTAGIDQKTLDATNAYNAYVQAKSDLAGKIADIQKNPNGMTASAVQAMVNDVTTKGNANLANLLIGAQTAQGLLTAAQQTVTDKINAQFQPIQDQITNLRTFAEVNNADLTQSESKQLDATIAQKTADAKVASDASKDVHQTLLAANAPTSVYSQLDQVTSDYQSGKITGQQASDEYYKIAAPYGISIKDQAAIIAQTNATNIAVADLKLRQATYNDGNFLDSNGNPIDVVPQSIPGFTLFNNGTAVINGTNLPTKYQGTSIGGIPVIPQDDMPAFTLGQQAQTLLTTVQGEYNAILAAGKGATPEMNAQYSQDAVTLNGVLATAAKQSSSKGAPFAGLGTLTVPTKGGIFGTLPLGYSLTGLWHLSLSSVTNDRTTFANIQTQINSGLSALAPAAGTPIFGQVFKSPADVKVWTTQNGYTNQYNNLIASYPKASAQQILDMINTGQPLK